MLGCTALSSHQIVIIHLPIKRGRGHIRVPCLCPSFPRHVRPRECCRTCTAARASASRRITDRALGTRAATSEPTGGTCSDLPRIMPSSPCCDVLLQLRFLASMAIACYFVWCIKQLTRRRAFFRGHIMRRSSYKRQLIGPNFSLDRRPQWCAIGRPWLSSRMSVHRRVRRCRIFERDAYIRLCTPRA